MWAITLRTKRFTFCFRILLTFATERKNMQCEVATQVFSHFLFHPVSSALDFKKLPTVFKVWIYRKESTLANLRRLGFLCHYFFTTNTAKQVVSWLLTCSTRSWPVKKDTYMYVRDKLQASDDVTTWVIERHAVTHNFFNISGWWIRTDYPRATDQYDLSTPTGPGPPEVTSDLILVVGLFIFKSVQGINEDFIFLCNTAGNVVRGNWKLCERNSYENIRRWLTTSDKSKQTCNCPLFRIVLTLSQLTFRKACNVVLNNFNFYTRHNRHAHGKTSGRFSI